MSRTPMALVRGSGPARSGTHHYWQQRVNSIALLPLTVYLIGVAIALIGADHASAVATLGNPFVALPMFLFILLNAQHMRLGLAEVIADYVQDKGAKLALMLLNAFFSYGVAAAAAFALVKLAFEV